VILSLFWSGTSVTRGLSHSVPLVPLGGQKGSGTSGTECDTHCVPLVPQSVCDGPLGRPTHSGVSTAQKKGRPTGFTGASGTDESGTKICPTLGGEPVKQPDRGRRLHVMGMTLRERIKSTITYRIAMEQGGSFSRRDICRDLMPAWDSADAAPRWRLSRDVGSMLHRMVKRGELCRAGPGAYTRPVRPIVYLRPLAVVPAVVRDDMRERGVAA